MTHLPVHSFTDPVSMEVWIGLDSRLYTKTVTHPINNWDRQITFGIEVSAILQRWTASYTLV